MCVTVGGFAPELVGVEFEQQGGSVIPQHQQMADTTAKEKKLSMNRAVPSRVHRKILTLG